MSNLRLNLTPTQTSFVAILCLFFIFVAQVYLVYDYFQTTKASLIRESNVIMEDAFKAEFKIRHRKFREIIHDKVITYGPPPEPTKENTFKIKNIEKTRAVMHNEISTVEMAMNHLVTSTVPLDIIQLDSVTNEVLLSRDIHTDFSVELVDILSNKVLQRAGNIQKSGFFLVSSKLIPFDIPENKYLRLTLINPFALILKRMGMMLLSSLVLAMICLLAFRYLLKVLARQKQLVAFKNEFLGSIAHELKRPVASLTFNLDCMTLPAFENKSIQRDLLVSRSIHATTELNATINMIVTLSKVQEGLLVLNKTVINLTNLLEERKNEFIVMSNKKIDICIQTGNDDLCCVGDSQLLSQCFANLIDNAIKYSNHEVLIVISLQKHGNCILISFKDNGIGIPEDKLLYIFEKYVRVHTEDKKINGFGIGLNYVKTIIEQHKGKVEVKSNVGEGSEFLLWLPDNQSA